MSKVNLRELLNKMTTKQKIAQLEQLAARYFTKNKTDITGPLRDLGLTEDELKINPPSRSAKLRIAKKIKRDTIETFI